MSFASNVLSHNQVVYVCTFEIWFYPANIDKGSNILNVQGLVPGAHVHGLVPGAHVEI